MELTQEEYLYGCLSAAYLQLLLKKEKGDITVNEVCTKAGVSRSAFYRLLGKKDFRQELFLFHGFLIAGPYLRINDDHASAIKDLYRFLYANREYAIVGVEKDPSSFLLFLLLSGETVGKGGLYFPALFPKIEELAKGFFVMNFEEAYRLALRELSL